MTRANDLPAGDELDDLIDAYLWGADWPDNIASPYNAKGRRRPLYRYSRDDHAAAELMQFFITGFAGRTICTVEARGDPDNRKRGIRWGALIESDLDGEGYYGNGSADTYALAVARAFVHLHEDKEMDGVTMVNGVARKVKRTQRKPCPPAQPSAALTQALTALLDDAPAKEESCAND
jgi:hypothetical protein